MFTTLDIKFKCEALIDQDLVIGGDPCGHACYNDATHQLGPDDACILVCEECRDMLRAKSSRITLRYIPLSIVGRCAMYEKVMCNALDSIRKV